MYYGPPKRASRYPILALPLSLKSWSFLRCCLRQPASRFLLACLPRVFLYAAESPAVPSVCLPLVVQGFLLFPDKGRAPFFFLTSDGEIVAGLRGSECYQVFGFSPLWVTATNRFMVVTQSIRRLQSPAVCLVVFFLLESPQLYDHY